MKRMFFLFLMFKHLVSIAQPQVHQAVFYRDDESVASGFLGDKITEIQSQLDYLKSNNCFVNIILMSKECPPLELVSINGKTYYSGPSYNDNGKETSLWLSSENNYYVLQFLPRQARVYYSNNSNGSFWEAADVSFDTPVLSHKDNYYCAIKKSLDLILTLKGLNTSPANNLCQEGDSTSVLASLTMLPKIYLDRQSSRISALRSKQIMAKTNFCTNLVYYAPYLHTRSLNTDIFSNLELNIMDGYLLVTATPNNIQGSGLFKDLFFNIAPGVGYNSNCYPLLRELSEQDRIDVLYQMHGGSNAGSEVDFQNVKIGTDYLLKSLLSSASSPIPGNTQCDYGENNNYDLSSNYQYISYPYTQFSGNEINPPQVESGVTWFNDFSNSSSDVITECKNATTQGAAQGLDLKFNLASGCTPNTPQFGNSIDNHTNTNLTSNGVSIWMYYDECDDRLYYDVRFSDGLSSHISSGYAIQNPDSIQKIIEHIEKVAEEIIRDLSKIESYDNADLYESEYPSNMQHTALSSFFGLGSTCGNESPWRFGLREGHKFSMPEVVGECISILLRIFTEQSIPQSLWHPQPTEQSMLDMPGGAAGIIDACLNLVDGKVWNLTGLLTASVEFYKADAPTRKEILKSLTDPVNLILGQYPQNFDCINSAECQEERIYCFVNLLSNAVIDIFGRGLLSAIGNIGNAGATITDKMKMFSADFDNDYNSWKRTLSESEQKGLHVFMEGLPESSKFKLAKHVTLNKIWMEVESGSIPGITSEDFKNFLDKIPPYQNSGFYNELEKLILNADKKIENSNLVKNFINDFNNPDASIMVTSLSESPSKYLPAWKEADAANFNHLRINIEFLNVIYDFQSDNPKQHFIEHGCTLADEAIIRLYTTDYHSALNLALLGVSPMTEEFLEFKEAFQKSIDKLPNYSGKVYRGLGKFESDIAAGWGVGSKISSANWEKKVLSTSISLKEANTFKDRGAGYVILVVEASTKGKYIAPISKYPFEAEVVYNIGIDMEVSKIEINPDDPDEYIIYLIEV